MPAFFARTRSGANNNHFSAAAQECPIIRIVEDKQKLELIQRQIKRQNNNKKSRPTSPSNQLSQMNLNQLQSAAKDKIASQ